MFNQEATKEWPNVIYEERFDDAQQDDYVDIQFIQHKAIGA
jgi:hypothetical protein